MADLDDLDISGLIDLCPDPIIRVGRSGTIDLINRAAESLLGYPDGRALGRVDALALYGSLERAKEVKRRLWQEHSRGRQLRGWETVLVSATGREIPVRLSATLVFHGGEEVGSVGFFHDLSEQKALQADLEKLSITDDLTGLYNHRHFHDQLLIEVQRSERYGRPLSLLYFDLDDFKLINDCNGHPAGDEVLRFVAGTLDEVMRKTDSAYRYGGDEFVLVLPETSVDDALRLGDRLRSAVADRWPFEFSDAHDEPLRVRLSIGVAQHRTGEAEQELLQRVDAAMYVAKREGGDRVHVAD